ncbi:MAG: hypothetical protein F6J93_28810 [Oscillatoria sp. SIO1A7]|nr:hypothetical protein [Oscillatoria sp. SIO1A7]
MNENVGATASRNYLRSEREFPYWDASPQKPHINLRIAAIRHKIESLQEKQLGGYYVSY